MMDPSGSTERVCLRVLLSTLYVSFTLFISQLILRLVSTFERKAHLLKCVHQMANFFRKLDSPTCMNCHVSKFKYMEKSGQLL